MPPPKATKRAGTSSQPSLKASFAAVRNAKGAVSSRKKVETVTPIVTDVVATPPVKEAVPNAAPKKSLKKRHSTTDEDSEEEEDYEPISPTLDLDGDGKSGDDVVEVTTHEERPQLGGKDKGVNKHLGKVNEKKSGVDLGIHTEDESKTQKILRVFDLSYQYGPCVGMTRLERWNRAKALGLDPPVEVRDILLTQQGEEEFAESIFYRRV